MQTLYIEQDVYEHPRVQAIRKRFNKATIITCDRYQEVFNPKSQNFRLQKQNPALILATRHGRRVIPTPENLGIGGQANYYFSHLLNCPYDCRYCFLQGMYPSAHYVLFINYEDFMTDMTEIIQQSEQPCYFFTGYDADSLAYEAVSHFAKDFLPFMADFPDTTFEFRTKSTQIRSLLKQRPLQNCVMAFSLTPASISKQLEHRVPSLQKRLAAMQSLAEAGWPIGLRFDPLIYASDYQQLYKALITEVFETVPAAAIHSVSIGLMRFPEKMYQRIVKLYPNDKLFAQPLEKRGKLISYKADIETQMHAYVSQLCRQYLPAEKLFSCTGEQ